MATEMVSSPAPRDDKPLFQRLEFFPREISKAMLDGDVVRRFTVKASAVASGVRAVMELGLDDLYRAERRDDADAPRDADRPLLSKNQLEALQRLAIQSLEMLEGECEQLMTWAHEHRTPEGKELRARRERARAGT